MVRALLTDQKLTPDYKPELEVLRRAGTRADSGEGTESGRTALRHVPSDPRRSRCRSRAGRSLKDLGASGGRRALLRRRLADAERRLSTSPAGPSSSPSRPIGDHIVRISIVPLEAGQPQPIPSTGRWSTDRARAPVLRLTELAEPQVGRPAAKRRVTCLTESARRSASKRPMAGSCRELRIDDADGRLLPSTWATARCSAWAKAVSSSIVAARSTGCAAAREDTACARTAAACRSPG